VAREPLVVSEETAHCPRSVRPPSETRGVSLDQDSRCSTSLAHPPLNLAATRAGGLWDIPVVNSALGCGLVGDTALALFGLHEVGRQRTTPGLVEFPGGRHPEPRAGDLTPYVIGAARLPN
jgi:hypothetical protein